VSHPIEGAEAPIVQDGIRRVFDEASSYYSDLRWGKTRLTRFEKAQTQRTLEEELGPDRVSSALELGCGPGTWTGLLTSRSDSVTAVDLSPLMLDHARTALGDSGVRFVLADASEFHSEQRFDRAISVRVIEYIPEWRAVTTRLGELVRPGGRVVLITKTKFSVWRGTGRERWFTAAPRKLRDKLLGRLGSSDFWQQYIPARALQRALREAGFTEIRVRPVIFGLPIFARGTKQYPIIPTIAEPPILSAFNAGWEWVSARGEAVRNASLLLSESYAVSGTHI
jgi:SAM-dependent methyltransferase